MRSKPATCKGCPLEAAGSGFIGTRGSGSSGILFVGEAPGKDELAPGKPFVGKAGQLLDRLLYRLGTTQDVHVVDNVIRCRPPGNELAGADYEAGATVHCSPHLDETVASTKPRVIVALGNSALKRCVGVSGISRYRGFILDSRWSNVPVVATFHPSFLLPRRGSKSGAQWTGTVLRDIRTAMRLAESGFTRPTVHYLEDPPQEVFKFYADSWRSTQTPWLSVDIETNYKTRKELEATATVERGELITRISFSNRARFGLSVPFEGAYREIAKELLERYNGRTVGWNSRLFDIPRLREIGDVGTLLEHHYDAMDMWHTLLPNVPKGLEFAASYGCAHLLPWKHLNKSDAAMYSAIDADATVTLAHWLEAQ